MLIKTIAYCFFCICAGSAVSAGFVAFITMLGIFDKLAEQMKSGKGGHRIEALIIAGVTIGNAAYLFDSGFRSGWQDSASSLCLAAFLSGVSPVL